MSERAQLLLPIADDELVLGWRNSEWTGIAPFLEEDVAFSSIAQNEIGHARALYQLVAEELGTTADELAFDRKPEEYRCSPFVELRFVPDWAKTIARHYLYEEADERRIKALMGSDDAEVAGLAAKIDREEAYHRMHAQMWSTGSDEPRSEALGARPTRSARARGSPRGRRSTLSCGRWSTSEASTRRSSAELWDEMTLVRRSVPGATW